MEGARPSRGTTAPVRLGMLLYTEPQGVSRQRERALGPSQGTVPPPGAPAVSGSAREIPRAGCSFALQRLGKWLTCLLCAVFLEGFSATAAGAEDAERDGWQVAGEVASLLVQPSGRVVSSNATQFAITVVERSWRLRLESEGQAPKPALEFYSDGTNVVQVVRTLATGSGALPVVVHAGGYPAMGPVADVVWLAFGSSAYLDAGRPLTAPWLSAQTDPRAYLFEAVVERQGADPQVPASVKFVARPSRSAEALASPLLTQAASRNRQLRMPEGMVAGEYRLLQTTNVNGLSIPWEFELGCGADVPPARGRGSDGQGGESVRMVFRGRAQAIERVRAKPGLPPFTGVAQVSDRRFSGPGGADSPIRYAVTNQWMLSATDPAVRDSLDRERLEARARRPATAVAGAMGLVLFLVCVLLLQTKWSLRLFPHA